MHSKKFFELLKEANTLLDEIELTIDKMFAEAAFVRKQVVELTE